MEQKQSIFTMVTPLPQEMAGIPIQMEEVGMQEMEIIPSSSLMTLRERVLIQISGILIRQAMSIALL